jgi:hypothetical protein
MKGNIPFLIAGAALLCMMSAWADLFLFAKVIFTPHWAQVIDPVFLIMLVLLALALSRTKFTQALREISILILVVPVAPVAVYAQRYGRFDEYLLANLLLQYLWVVFSSLLLPAIPVVLLRYVVYFIAHRR